MSLLCFYEYALAEKRTLPRLLLKQESGNQAVVNGEVKDAVPCATAGGHYLIFDCPGQVELFTLQSSLKVVVEVLTNKWHVRYVRKRPTSCRSENGLEAGFLLVEPRLCTGKEHNIA
jgi:Conserved hypothetical ATP binding protein